MAFMIRGVNSDAPTFTNLPNSRKSSTAKDNTLCDGDPLTESLVLPGTKSLLELYLDTPDDAPLMTVLHDIRDVILEDLDQVNEASEIYGLLYWLMQDYGVEHRGESLEETADRLGDIDIENDTDQYTQLIFHLKDAVERLYDLELDT